MSRPFILAASAVLLGACASIVTGSEQSLSVTTVDVNGANCKLSNSKGTWYIPSTPGSVTVHRAYGPLSVECHKGELNGLAQADSKTKGMMAGNILFGGGIGAAVDAGTGAGYDYPEIINVPMAKGTPSLTLINPPAPTVAQSDEQN